MDEEPQSIRIPESRVRVTLAVLTPPLLLGLAILTLAVGSPTAVPLVFGAMGTVLGIVVIFDFPIAIDVSDEGLVRVCLIRHQRLSWDEIAAIIKPRRRGLVLVTRSRKRHVLVDRLLEPSERKALISMGEANGVQIEL